MLRTMTALVVASAQATTYEWAGTFATPSAAYVWTAQSVDGAYVDPGMKMVVLPVEASSTAALAALESEGARLINTTCVDVHTGGKITPADDVCYQLHFNAHLHTSIYEMDATGVRHVAIFAEYFPIEFERSMHYLKDAAGEDIEPVAELPEPATPDKPWGEAIGASIVVLVCTWVGLLFLVPCFAGISKRHPNALGATLNAFAAGALLSCAFYLMLLASTLRVGPSARSADAFAGSGCPLVLCTAGPRTPAEGSGAAATPGPGGPMPPILRRAQVRGDASHRQAERGGRDGAVGQRHPRRLPVRQCHGARRHHRHRPRPPRGRRDARRQRIDAGGGRDDRRQARRLRRGGRGGRGLAGRSRRRAKAARARANPERHHPRRLHA